MKTITHVLLVILLLVFSGCASMSKRTKCVCASAAAGAGVGAGLGAIVGFQGDRDSGEGAAVGVAVGGLVGGALGLILCKGEELDSDGDGVPDSIDECPNTPIGVEVDAKGCPIDSDGDGVPDYLDKCPNTPKGCKVDKDGCPIDSDGDGVPDCLDKCPNTPRDTKVDKNGCPIVGEELLILHGIKFGFDSAKVSDDSEAILEVAVTTLKKNPKMKVEIEGHTDSIGTAEYNLGLSQKRADSVKDHLIAKGIGAERLQTVGKGEADPLVSNELREGRAKNRRVEFVVISK
jgi:OOP family OmpA-OmpF porin